MKIGLLGCGVVGSGVKNIIDSMKNFDIEISKILVKDSSQITESRMTTNIDDLLKSNIDLIVECIGGIDIPFKYISMALKAKKNVVTSNKKVLATHYKELLNLAKENGVILAFEASVGGGIPWLQNIRQIKRIDDILSFKGIFNGTTNYILDNMTKRELDFDITLKEAQKLGYAENDPSDDIDGHDVKYKCAISANTIWDTSINLDDILYFGIRNIKKVDIDFATKNNKIIKLIGQAQKENNAISITVLPTFVSKDENIAHLPDNLNYASINSNYLGESTYIGQGAGKYPTAHAVVQDIISIYKKQIENNKINNNFKLNEDYLANFYIRTDNIKNFEKITLKKINDNTIITKNINLKDIVGLVDKNTFLAEVKI